MEDASSVSNLSSTSSRSEHMAYLMNDLSLDRGAAAMMYRAERLQEKGQLQQALRYFDRVLASHPTCEEAAVNARMIREQLAEEGSSQRLAPVTEEEVQPPVAAATAAVALPSTTMEFIFECVEKEEWDAYYSEEDLRKAALDEARRRLEEDGIRTPFVQLESFDVKTWTLPVDIDPWMDSHHTCHAVVRVSFPPVGATPQSRPAASGRVTPSRPMPGATAAAAAAEPDQEPSLCGGSGSGHKSKRSEVNGKSMLEQLQGQASNIFGEATTSSPAMLPQTCAAAAADGESAHSSGSRRTSCSARS